MLDRIDAGAPAEKALTGWARGSRFAGSKDRAAVRDHVFQALRCWRSYACLGGADTGRARMIGALRDQGVDPARLFDGAGHAPRPLSDDEAAAGHDPAGADAVDLPEWLWREFQSSLGAAARPSALALRERAPIMLRVNLARATRDEVRQSLAAEGICAAPHGIAPSALVVSEGERRIARSQAFETGLIELQDGSGQAAIEGIPLPEGGSVLDYCAGGGGKALAFAARGAARVFAHDVDHGRMRDLPVRAARAGVRIDLVSTLSLADNAPYSVVFCDAPCSGSGTWRRSPDAKWRLTPDRLVALTRMQSDILVAASPLVAPGGRLIYATCSVLEAENEARIAAFLSSAPGWRQVFARRFDISDGGDGFFVAHLARIGEA